MNTDYIKEIIYKFLPEIKEKEILIIVNQKGISKIKNYRINEEIGITEFFSLKEVSEIMQFAKKYELDNCKVLYSEREFMEYVLNNQENINNILVHNFAKNGSEVGKKSLIPSFCDYFGIPYVGSNAYVASLCRHKFHYSKLLGSLGYSIASSWMFSSHGWENGITPPIGLEVIIKPVYESSSIGVNETSVLIYQGVDDLILEKVNKYNQPVIVQEFIRGYEIEVPCLIIDSIIPLMPVGIKINNKLELGRNILTEEYSNTDRYGFYEFESSSNFRNEILQHTQHICRSIGAECYARVDYRVDYEGHFFVTDIATTPYITKHSSFAFAFEKMNFMYEELELFLLILGLKKRRTEEFDL